MNFMWIVIVGLAVVGTQAVPRFEISLVEATHGDDAHKVFDACVASCDDYQRECRARAPCLLPGEKECMVIEFGALAKCQTICSMCYLGCAKDAMNTTSSLVGQASQNSCQGDCSSAESDCERNTPCIASKPRWAGGGCLVHNPTNIAICQASGAACQAGCAVGG